MKKILLLTLNFVFSASVLFAAEASLKILTVDLGEVYSKYDKAVESQEKFTQATSKAQDEVNAMLKSGIELGEEFKALQAKANNPALNEEARKDFMEKANEKAKEIEKKQYEIAQYQEQMGRTLAERRQSVVNLHMSEIKDVVSKHAQAQKVDMVLNTTGVAVMYSDPKLDITTKVISQLNNTAKSAK